MRFGSVRSGRQDPNLAYPPPNSAGPGFFYYNGKGENRNGTLQGVGRQLFYAPGENIRWFSQEWLNRFG